MKNSPSCRAVARGSGVASGGPWLLVACLSVFVLFRPYQGIVHDARLYVGYAIAALDPNGAGRDLVFVHDGQARFSVYPMLIRALSETVGPSRAAMLLTYSGLLGWFTAFVTLVRRLLGDQMRAVQMAAVVVLASSLPAYYGGQSVFQTAEFYATPRVFAETCVLAALAALVTRRTTVMVVSLAVGCVFHPLMTAPALGIALWDSATDRRARLLWCASTLVAAAALATGTMAFDAAGMPFARFDQEWMTALRLKRALVFFRYWTRHDVERVVVQLITVVLALPTLHVASQRVVRSTLVVVGAAAAFSLLVGDLLLNVLVTQVQMWRGLWILSTLATVMCGVLLWSAWAQNASVGAPSAARDLRRAASLLLLLAWVTIELPGMGVSLSLLALLLWQLPVRAPNLSLPPHGLRVIGGMVALIGIGIVTARSWISLTTAWASPDTTMRWSWITMVATGVPGLLVLSLAFAVLAGHRVHWPRRFRPALPWLAGGLLLCTVLVVDSRTRYQRFIEGALDARARGAAPRAPFVAGQSIVWPDAELEPWALAGGTGWGTRLQGISIVFNRDLAREWTRRRSVIGAAGLLTHADTGARMIQQTTVGADMNRIHELCAVVNPPDLVVLPLAQWRGAPIGQSHRPDERKLLPPVALGEPWGVVPEYGVLRCAAYR